MLGFPARMRTSVFGTRSLHVIPTVPQAAHVKFVEPFISVEGPRLTAVQGSGENTGTVYCYLGVTKELPVIPHSLRQSSEGGGHSTYPSFGIERKVVRAGGFQVRKLMYKFKCITGGFQVRPLWLTGLKALTN